MINTPQTERYNIRVAANSGNKMQVLCNHLTGRILPACQVSDLEIRSGEVAMECKGSSFTHLFPSLRTAAACDADGDLAEARFCLAVPADLICRSRDWPSRRLRYQTSGNPSGSLQMQRPRGHDDLAVTHGSFSCMLAYMQGGVAALLQTHLNTRSVGLKLIVVAQGSPIKVPSNDTYTQAVVLRGKRITKRRMRTA